MSVFINRGINCYLNSVLQMLATSNEIRERIDIDSIKNIMDQYDKKSILDPIGVMYYLNKEHHVDLNVQNDVNEILGYILDSIKDKEKYQIELKSVIYDKNGDLLSENKSTEFILNLELKYSFEKSIESYFSTQELENDRFIKILPLNSPEFLFVSLKRFNYENSRFVKINSEINVLSHFEYNSYVYKPISYIYHIGKYGSGHYTAFCEDIKNPGMYVMYDDIKKFRVPYEDFVKIQSVSYIILFKRLCQSKDFNEQMHSYTPNK